MLQQELQMLKLPSNRRFGLFFALVFTLAAFYLIAAQALHYAAASLFIAFSFMLLALLRPGFLVHLNKAWMLLGLLIGKVISPLVMGVIFFLILTPMALVMRGFGRDALHLKADKSGATYWKPQEIDAQNPAFFKKQY
ncbi:SxtJ family membrane protein [Polycladidibacter stylochi]|uniref:SxtJ family membrane protein n=1 Tax=Polycladidibacter stylochi TaxID=1807766 RepID=UPI00082A44CC|nr:SxtJ family membrane protein [Pseudovibrio stylochi]